MIQTVHAGASNTVSSIFPDTCIIPIGELVTSLLLVGIRICVSVKS